MKSIGFGLKNDPLKSLGPLQVKQMRQDTSTYYPVEEYRKRSKKGNNSCTFRHILWLAG